MEDMKTEILSAAKAFLEINSDESDELLMILIDEAINAVLSYCRLEVLPRQLVSFIPVIAARQFRSDKNVGVKSVAEGERRVEYCDEDYDFLSEYATRLRPFISRQIKLPSDLDMEEGNDDKSV